jgi:hypothetical protein
MFRHLQITRLYPRKEFTEVLPTVWCLLHLGSFLYGAYGVLIPRIKEFSRWFPSGITTIEGGGCVITDIEFANFIYIP